LPGSAALRLLKEKQQEEKVREITNMEISRYTLPYTLLPFPILAELKMAGIKTQYHEPAALKKSLKVKTKK